MDNNIVYKKNERLGEEKLNNQGCLMRIIEYINALNIIIEFQDEYKIKIRTKYQHFLSGNIKNPCHPSVYSVGIVGDKYSTSKNYKALKEYKTWVKMLERCFDSKTKEKFPTYRGVTCCNEWLYYPNFYEWLHEQENFDKWYDNDCWDLDKDILIKGNKIYSPETCCLVPHNINTLFRNFNTQRKDTPIGVIKYRDKFRASCKNLLTKKTEYLGDYQTPEEAFFVFKEYKEKLIRQIAKIEYYKSNITKKCYTAMMEYKVEITD